LGAPPPTQYLRAKLRRVSASLAATPIRGPEPWDGRDLVVVNEQAGELGGTERVLDAILRRYPAARFAALRFGGGNVDAERSIPWANRVTLGSGGERKRHFFAPLYAQRTAQLPIGGARVVLSLTHGGWSLAAAVPDGARHVTYRAGPPRALYDGTNLYLADYAAPARTLIRAALPALRAHDRHLMSRPDCVLTNSHASRQWLERLYGVAAQVVYPPVRTDFFTPGDDERDGLLVVSRLNRYKQVGTVLGAMRALPDERSVVVGGGPLLDELRAQAPPNVRFTGYVHDEQLRALYRRAVALVCPSVEDFGIVMAEAHACGTPVIAVSSGGAREIVDDPKTGVLVQRLDAASLTDALRTIRRRGHDSVACRRSSLRFTEERFVDGIDRVLGTEYALARH
jgi:glycosyltransferase involved in cell wall biosynthesis